MKRDKARVSEGWWWNCFLERVGEAYYTNGGYDCNNNKRGGACERRVGRHAWMMRGDDMAMVSRCNYKINRRVSEKGRDITSEVRRSVHGEKEL